MESLTTYLNSVSSSIFTEAKADCIATNIVNVVFGGKEKCGSDESAFDCYEGNCQTTISQTAFSDCSIDAESYSTVAATLNSQISTVLTQFAKQLEDADSEWLSTALSLNIGSINTSAELVSTITNEISLQDSLTCSVISSAANESNVVFCGKYTGSIEINQNATAQAIASCMNTAILNAFVTNTTLQQIDQQTDSDLSASTAGLSWWVWLIVGIVVIVVIIIIAVVVSKSGKKPPPPAPQAQPSIIMAPRSTAPPSRPTGPPTIPPTAATPVAQPPQSGALLPATTAPASPVAPAPAPTAAAPSPPPAK